MNAPPRVLLIIGDQWDRALIRAALREVGYDAVGARDVSEAHRYRAIEPGRGPVRLIVIDQEAAPTGQSALSDIVALHRSPPVILVGRGTQPPPTGPWRRVIRRPLSIGDLAAAVQSELPLPEDARRPLDVEAD